MKISLMNLLITTGIITLIALKRLKTQKDGLKDLKDVSYENPYEAYLITQIKLTEELPPVIDEHIRMLNVGDDIDSVLESFESKCLSILKRISTVTLENGKCFLTTLMMNEFQR